MLPVGPLPLDAALGTPIRGIYPAWAISLFDELASAPIADSLLLVIAAWSWVRRRPALAVASMVGLLVDVPTEIVKVIVARPRPPGAAVEAVGSIAGYPSGHTARAVVVAAVIAVAFLRGWRNRGVLARTVAACAVVTIAVLVGLARIASRDHWPSDVVGGAVLGAAWLSVAAAAYERTSSRWSGIRSPPGK